jgi:hypothetical protein
MESKLKQIQCSLNLCVQCQGFKLSDCQIGPILLANILSADTGLVTIFRGRFISFGHPSFPEMVRPIEQVPICLSLEEVTVHAGNQGLMKIDKCLLKGILDRQLRPNPIPLLINIID